MTLRCHNLSVQGGITKKQGAAFWGTLCCLLEGGSSHQNDALSVHKVQVVLPKWYQNEVFMR